MAAWRGTTIRIIARVEDAKDGCGLAGIGVYLEPLGAHLVDVELREAGGLLGLGGQVRGGNVEIDSRHGEGDVKKVLYALPQDPKQEYICPAYIASGLATGKRLEGTSCSAAPPAVSMHDTRSATAQLMLGQGRTPQPAAPSALAVSPDDRAHLPCRLPGTPFHALGGVGGNRK